MSYCRFSSDDWTSDFYVWSEGDQGVVVQVAGNRPVGPIPAVDERLLFEDPAAFAAAHRIQMDFLMAAERRPIDHPEAGSHHRLATPGEAADLLERLGAEGLRVPRGAIASLRADQDHDPEGDAA